MVENGPVLLEHKYKQQTFSVKMLQQQKFSRMFVTVDLMLNQTLKNSRTMCRAKPGQVGETPLRPRGTSLGIGLGVHVVPRDAAPPCPPPSTGPPAAVLALLAWAVTAAPPTFMCSNGGGARTHPFPLPVV